jgi:hypothetical protein
LEDIELQQIHLENLCIPNFKSRLTVPEGIQHISFQIYDHVDEVTKPPKHWVDLPWPVRVNKDSRHASGLVIGEEYIPPTFDYNSKNIMGRMASGDDRIEHVKLTAGQVIPDTPVSKHSDWNIVPDPSSDGGLKLVESSFGDINPAEIPQQGSGSGIIYGNGDIYQENKGNNHGELSKILGVGMTSGTADTSGVSLAVGLQWPSRNVLGGGMSSAGVSVPNSPQRPSPNVLGSGMSSVGVSVPNSPQKRPSPNVLGSGMSSAVVVGTSGYIGSGYWRPAASILGLGVGSSGGGSDKFSNKGNQPMLHRSQKISQSGQQQSHSVFVESSSSRNPSLSSSKTGWRVSAPKQLQSQFLPAAHWHVSSVPVDISQKLPLVATGVVPATIHYLSPPSPGSQVHAEASSVSTS